MRELTGGRGPDAVIDAVGMEAHGAPIGKLAHRLAGLLPDAIARKAIETAGIDRLAALHSAIELVRRGGTVSLSGVYGGAASPMPLMQMFDKQITAAHGPGQRPALDRRPPAARTGDDDPLGVETFATHHIPLEEAPHGYEIFQKKQDGAFKVVLQAVTRDRRHRCHGQRRDERGATRSVPTERSTRSWPSRGGPPRSATHACAACARDVARDDLGEPFRGADAVIHLAWLIQPSRDDAELRAVNVDGTRRVFEAAARAGAQTLVHASSVGAYSAGPKDRASTSRGRPTASRASSTRATRRRSSGARRLRGDHPGVRVVRLRPG